MIIKSCTGPHISAEAINDKRLSDGAVATLAYLMGKPSGWSVYATEIADRYHRNRRTAQKYIDELISAGYAIKAGKSRKDGKTSYSYTVSDKPDNILSVHSVHTSNITGLKINAGINKCLTDLKIYMDMYNLIPDQPLKSIKPQIRQIILSGIKPKIFALYALDWMHGRQDPINIKEFAADAVKTLTYNSIPESTGKYDDCIVNYDMEVD